jgi:hypothetical protein
MPIFRMAKIRIRLVPGALSNNELASGETDSQDAQNAHCGRCAVSLFLAP